jgi:hypothetical protein
MWGPRISCKIYNGSDEPAVNVWEPRGNPVVGTANKKALAHAFLTGAKVSHTMSG